MCHIFTLNHGAEWERILLVYFLDLLIGNTKIHNLKILQKVLVQAFTIRLEIQER